MTRNPELVDATDLDVYGEQRPREAQELLPHLIRRLLANTPGVNGVSVRTGRLLRRLADGYARDARREDESAERAGDED